ncbi:alsin isoform X2 [Rhipicephalus sanguineus]|uniref:alsin isoform X2 n=1 Tax=Rhipicephalus sanguineus TaxID=34632 RepID=UPI0020C28AAB|nr:alsin isoform X2 [Rhipicephalus sanguineus]
MGVIEETPDEDKSPEVQGVLWTCNSPLSSISIGKYTVTFLSFGIHHCLFLTDDGAVFAFGKNNFGQLGSGNTVEYSTVPYHVTGVKHTAKDIACGPNHSAALTIDGTVYMWGLNNQGQCGFVEDTVLSPRKVEVEEELGKCKNCGCTVIARARFISVSCGPVHTLALTNNHKVFAWGTGPQLGLNAATKSLPKRIDSLKERKVLSVACGATHSLAVTENIPPVADNSPVTCSSCEVKSATCPLGLPCVVPTPVPTQDETEALQLTEETTDRAAAIMGNQGLVEGLDSLGILAGSTSVYTDNLPSADLQVQSLPCQNTNGHNDNVQMSLISEPSANADITNNAKETAVSTEKEKQETNAGNGQEAVHDEFEGIELRRGQLPMQRLRSASVPSKRTSSILNPEHAMEFLDRQLGHKPHSKARQSLAEDSVSEPSKGISSSTSSIAVKNMFSRVTSLFVDRLNFVSFAPQVSTAGSRSGSAESFELVEPDQISDTCHSEKTEGHLERPKSVSRSSYDREVQLPKQNMITQVWSWGKGAYGQLGHGDDLDRMQPCLMKHLNDSGVLKVSAGHGHSLALTCSFSVFSWGLNDVSQLGHNPIAKCISTPKLVAMPRNDLVFDIAAGQSHSLFLADGGGSYPVMYGCGQHQCVSSPYGCQKSKKVFPVMALKKGGLVTGVFAGGPSSGCLINLKETDEVQALYEFGASERRCLSNLCAVQHKVFLHLVKDGNIIADIPDYACKPLKSIISTTEMVVSLLSANAYDLTLLLQSRHFSCALSIMEKKDTWIDVFWSYTKAVTDFMAVGGFASLSRMLVFSPNALSHFAKDIVGDTSRLSSQSILQQLFCLPLKRIGEYTRLFSRLLASMDQHTQLWSNLQSCLNDWLALYDISTKEIKLAESTKSFWDSVNQKLADVYRVPECRMLRDSKSYPLQLVSAGRFATHHFVLFHDKFVHSHFGGFQNYSLELAWVEADTKSETVFAITTPEETLAFSCPVPSEKTEWVCCLNQAIRNLLNSDKRDNPVQSLRSGHSDKRLTPPMIRHASYVFNKLPVYKDATYKGSWLKGQLHGSGKLTWPDGRKYTGRFKNNLQHGEGEYIVPGNGGDTVFRGTWKNGKLHGLGSARYPNGNLYEGFFKDGLRDGHGILKEGRFLSSSSIYIGQWLQNKRHGYGVLDNEKEGEKYMGMWQDDCRHGNGIMVTLDDIYYEGNFVNNNLSGYGTMMFQDNTVFKGELGAGGSLNGKGVLSLSNGDTIQGSFCGVWSEGIKISGIYQKAVADEHSTSDVDSLIHRDNKGSFSMSVPASDKWRDIFDHCRDMLGIQGVSDAQDNKHAWDAIAIAISNRKRQSHVKKQGKPCCEENLDYLERIPQTSKKHGSLTLERYVEIKDYLTSAFDCVHHPLGYLLDGLVGVFRLTYCGIGVHPRLLVHAVEEVRSFCQRLYELVRILFPDLPQADKPLVLTSLGDVECPDDFLDGAGECITPNTLIQPVLLPRLYPSLSTLYALNNEQEDRHYWERLLKWNKQSDLALMTFLGVDEKFMSLKFHDNVFTIERNLQRMSSIKDECFTNAIEALQHISTAFTAFDKLQAIRQTFEEINKAIQKGLGDFLWNMDDLFPVFQYVVVRARIRNLGSEINFVDDLMERHYQNGELGIMFTTVKACYFQIRTEKLIQA